MNDDRGAESVEWWSRVERRLRNRGIPLRREDVEALLKRCDELARAADSYRNGAAVKRERRANRRIVALAWLLHNEEPPDQLPPAVAAAYDDLVNQLTVLLVRWWERRAPESMTPEDRIAWAERNAKHDPAPEEFLEHVTTTPVQLKGCGRRGGS